MSASRPELVIFDMDDVLCHYTVGSRLRYLAALAGTTARDVRAALWDSGFEEAADSGDFPDPSEYLREFGRRLGYPISEREWVEARRHAMAPNTEVLVVAALLKAQAEIAIYTNNGPIVKNNLESLLPEAALIFQQRFCSYEFGTKKPDPRSFSRLVESLGKTPSRCWFIDDKKSNVEGARLAGLVGHHYRNPALLIAEGRSLGFSL
ncbi:MAG: HAD family phosphatase [Proteobacteria bacterium]|nr:HAD family phosphatase [Pseudomonadota bacterium]